MSNYDFYVRADITTVSCIPFYIYSYSNSPEKIVVGWGWKLIDPYLESLRRTNNEIINRQNVQLRTLDRKQSQLQVMLQKAGKGPNYHKVMEMVDQRLNDKRSLLVAALIAVFRTLKTNPYGLNLLSSSPLDIESYLGVNIDGKNPLRFAESCYNSLLKSYAKPLRNQFMISLMLVTQ
jgi:hypothetical protein